MFKAYVPMDGAHRGAVEEIQGMKMVCVAQAESREELELVVASAWDGDEELVLVSPDGVLLQRITRDSSRFR
jgi:hypothetical protein